MKPVSSSKATLIEAAQPRYLQLARAIMQDIDSGRYAVGSLLPTESEFGEAYGMSRHTVREAMRLLSERGMISKQAGVGTRVEAKEAVKINTRSFSSVAELMQFAEGTSQSILGVHEVVAGAALCGLLHCKVGQRWYLIETSRYAKGDTAPSSFSQIYINSIYPGVVPSETSSSARIMRAPFFKLIEEQYGERPVEVQQTISATTLSARIAGILEAKAKGPALVLQRQYFGANGQLILAAVNTHPADRFSYSTRLRLE